VAKCLALVEDQNGDGVIQQDETRETKIKANNPHCVADADLNFYAPACTTSCTGSDCRPADSANGVPLYDDASLLHVAYARTQLLHYDLAVNPATGPC